MAYRFESGHRHQYKRGGKSLPFCIGIMPDSNPSKCNMPGACCCHQFKNWWLLYIFAKQKWQSSPVTSTPIQRSGNGKGVRSPARRFSEAETEKESDLRFHTDCPPLVLKKEITARFLIENRAVFYGKMIILQPKT